MIALPHLADPDAALDRERTLAEAVVLGTAPPTLALWSCGPALMVSRQDARLPAFPKAAAAMARAGQPCVVRLSGGGAVPIGRNTVMLSLAVPVPEPPPFGIIGIYAALAAPIIAALGAFGLGASFGTAPGAFCDGMFNLLVAGRKIAGTAQAWRAARRDGLPPARYALAHAALFTDADAAEGCLRVERFYEIAGAPRRLDSDSVDSVARLLGLCGASPNGLTRTLRAALSDHACRLVTGATGVPGAVQMTPESVSRIISASSMSSKSP